jgi:hypothetical protein
LLLAIAQELFDGGFELGAQLGHRFAVKANHGVQPKNAAYKDVVALVESRFLLYIACDSWCSWLDSDTF